MTETSRSQVAQRIKTMAMMSNYGLPTELTAGLSHAEIKRKFRAVGELWVRLDVWVALGEASSGTINFPEAKRVIEYRLNSGKPETSTVRFKALVKSGTRRR